MISKKIQSTTLLFLVAIGVSSFIPKPIIPDKTSYYLVIEKSENTITLYDTEDWVVQWPCTFGSNDISDKRFQGDRRTPEGQFSILRKYPHAKWHKMMMLNYPTDADRQKFEARKRNGEIPANAKIGGDIGIHGTWPHEDWAVENLQSWTQGCISMRNDHLDELYTLVSEGTTVYIKR